MILPALGLTGSDRSDDRIVQRGGGVRVQLLGGLRAAFRLENGGNDKFWLFSILNKRQAIHSHAVGMRPLS